MLHSKSIKGLKYTWFLPHFMNWGCHSFERQPQEYDEWAYFFACFCLIAACAAARRAIGTRKGEQLT